MLRSKNLTMTLALGLFITVLSTGNAHAQFGGGFLPTPKVPNIPLPKLPKINLMPKESTSQIPTPATNESAFRTGDVQIKNDYGGAIRIQHYHPQSPQRAMKSWTVGPSKTVTLVGADRKPFTVGNDWGIQVVFGNGVRSGIHRISRVSQQTSGRFAVRATNVVNWR